MLIEAARGGHSAVVGLLLQQPKFTTALKNQIAQQRQALSSRSKEQVASIAGKRKTRSSHPGAGGRGKKQLKSPIPRKDDGRMNMTGNVTTPDGRSRGEGGKGIPPGGVGGDGQVLMNGQQQQSYQFPQPHSQQPILGHQVSTEPDMTPPKKTPNYKPNSSHQPTVVVSPHNQLTTDEDMERIASSVTWNSAEDKSFEPSEFTVNPSYKFGQVSPSVNPDGTPLFPEPIPTAIPIPVPGTLPPASTTGSSSSVGNYLLPPIFAQSPAYSNQEHMEAYMKADEILRNHMMQLDYTKQQALMNALESLMLQSEAHRASIGIGSEDGEGNPRLSPIVNSPSSGEGPVVSSATNIVKPSSPFKGGNGSCGKSDMVTGKGTEGGGGGGDETMTGTTSKSTAQDSPTHQQQQSSSAPGWSFTDPSRMPQFSMGLSTLAPSANSPEKQSPKSSHHPSPGKHLTFAEKQAFASRIASRLEQVNRSPNTSQTGNTSSTTDYYSTTPVTQFFNSIDKQSAFHPPLVYNSPSKFNFSASGGIEKTGSVSPVFSGPYSPSNNGTREASPFTAVPLSSVKTVPSPNKATTPSATTMGPAELAQLPPVPLPNAQYLQPIYSPDLTSLKHLTHRLPSGAGGVPDLSGAQHFDANGRPHPLTSSVWLDANFPLDIPPPSDLIPEHVRRARTLFFVLINCMINCVQNCS